jgi:hypothetical protein
MALNHPRALLRRSLVMVVVAAMTVVPAGESSAALGSPDRVAFVDSGGWWRVVRPGQPDYTFQITLPASARVTLEWYLADWDGDGFDTPGVRYTHSSGVNLAWVNTLPGDGMSAMVDNIELSSGVWGDGEELFGDWDGDGIETLGWDAGASGVGGEGEGRIWLLNSWPERPPSPTPDLSFWFGRGITRGDVPLDGDVSGDGTDTMIVYRMNQSRFYYTTTNPAGPGVIAPTAGDFYFGIPGDAPLIGDWDGDGIDTAGVHRPSNGTVYLRNSLTTGVADTTHPDKPGTPFAGQFDLP